MRLTPLVLTLALACTPHHMAADSQVQDVDASLPDLEHAPRPSDRLDDADAIEALADDIDTWFADHRSRRLHVQLDRPLYRPGETVWLKTWNLQTRDLTGKKSNPTVIVELVDPRGQVIEKKLVKQDRGTATNDFALGADAPGGKWTLRARLKGGEQVERPFVVASYQAPQINKSLEFAREAYGPGDTVQALVELERGTGGALAHHPVRALLQVDGETVLEQLLETDATGALMVGAALPMQLDSGDGLLTVLVEDGGITESISRSVPIVMADLQLGFFPEGGDLVQGLPGRVYFEGTDRHGEPADVEGYIADDRGEKVAEFASLHDGMGRLAFTPERGRRYRAHITAPAGIATAYDLPAAQREGCALRAYDDVHSDVDAIRVGVRCTRPRDVLVTGTLQENVLDTAAVRAGPDRTAVVYLKPDADLADRQGAARVTVFDTDRNPLAERLVYRNPGQDLHITITPERESYGPRDEVVVDIKTTDPSGDPIAAEVALSVVDDAVLSYADDKEGHLLSRMYLESELPDSPKDPSFYFDDDEALAARGLDLVLGTKGYRRFEWRPVFDPARSEMTAVGDTSEFDIALRIEADELQALEGVRFLDAVASVAARERRDRRQPRPLMKKVPGAMAPPMADVPMAEAEPAEQRVPMDEDLDFVMEDKQEEVAQDIGGLIAPGVIGHRGMAHDGVAGRAFRAVAGKDVALVRANQLAPVRVFPKPDYSAGFTGVRSDFRDTVHWEPSVRTDKWGNAEVRFYMSDAVTSFRVTAEGVAGGFAGHGEQSLVSTLPVSIATKLPPAVSAGDRLMLPVTVKNTRSEDIDVDISSAFGPLLVASETTGGRIQVAGDDSDTFWIPLDVSQGSDTASITLQAEGGGLTDTVEHNLLVVPAGFPRSWSAAGELTKTSEQHVRIGETVPHSLTASVTWHPSTVSTLITGMEGLIRTPGGCFEQTSSTNWPNVMILKYLETHDGDPRLRMKSSQALDAGYAKLTGYQVGAGGFETWGSGPGKEALSAFGLLQFADMKQVYGVKQDVLDRDATYLLGQRDGSGGYRKTGESAHGYGSAPPEILDAFITWSLVATGHADQLKTEVAHQAKMARTSRDPYVLALATRTLVHTQHAGANAALDKLVALQAADGSFPGAKSSITRSYEANLVVESTALAALAIMESGRHRQAADASAKWLVENRQGAGTWGATQATALALAALTKHAEVNTAPRSSGTLWVEVNGKRVGTIDYTADQTEPLVIDGWEDALKQGDNQIVLRHAGGEPLPFTVDVSWTALNPASTPGAELALTTALDKDELRMGETTRLTATVQNQAGRIVPSPIARIGLPAGLEAQTWQLEQLQERGEIAFFETRPREVTIYWDGLHDGDSHEVELDLVAFVPGAFTGPASSAYPYYNDDEKAWDAGLQVAIGRASGAR